MKLRTAFFALLAVLPVGLYAGSADGTALAPMDGSTYVNTGKPSDVGVGTNAQEIMSGTLNAASGGGYNSGLSGSSATNTSSGTYSNATSDPASSNTLSNSKSSETTAAEQALETGSATSTGATYDDIGTPKGYSHRSADPNDHSIEIGRGTEKMIDTGDKDFRSMVKTAPTDKRFSSSLLDIGLSEPAPSQADKDEQKSKPDKTAKPAEKTKDVALTDDDQRFKKFVPTTDEAESEEKK
jgi:hypothetical protein